MRKAAAPLVGVSTRWLIRRLSEWRPRNTTSVVFPANWNHTNSGGEVSGCWLQPIVEVASGVITNWSTRNTRRGVSTRKSSTEASSSIATSNSSGTPISARPVRKESGKMRGNGSTAQDDSTETLVEEKIFRYPFGAVWAKRLAPPTKQPRNANKTAARNNRFSNGSRNRIPTNYESVIFVASLFFKNVMFFCVPARNQRPRNWAHKVPVGR